MGRVACALLLAVLATVPARAEEPSLDQMLGALKAAPDERSAGLLENEIKSRWQSAASPAVKLLLSRAMRELGENAPGDAVDSFDAALDLSPDLLEGWRGRALARARMGDSAGAVRDLQEAVRREPRDFAAFQELSHLAEGRGDLDGAVLAWRKVLELDPKSPEGAARLRSLQRLRLGQGA